MKKSLAKAGDFYFFDSGVSGLAPAAKPRIVRCET
jgi:hypothetical protein